MAVNELPIFVMACIATLSMVATIGIFWTGIFALLAGRDTVWECSWQWPGRLIASLQAIGETRIVAGAREAFAGFIMNEPRRPWSAPGPLHLQRPPAARRPVSEHYLTVGARARLRGDVHGSHSGRRAA